MTAVMEHGRFYGRLRETRRVAGLALSETTYTPALRVPRHAHAHPFLVLVLQGAFVEQTRWRDRTLGAGTLLFHPPDEPHAHRFLDADARCFVVELDGRWLARVGEVSGAMLPMGGPRDVRHARANWLAAQLYDEFALGVDGSPLAIEGLALAILGDLHRVPAPASARGARWLATVREAVDARFREPLCLADLAALAGVHPTHLSRAFRQEFGCTLSDYVRQRRIAWAAEALAGSATPISQVALDAGYADQGHFTRQFKRVTGLTPGAFRTARRAD